jgi:two-component system, OmpR family, response regulator VicR
MKVLVVDDEAAIAETLCDALEVAGYEPIFAGDGCEGLREFEKSSPDLVVSDVMMPGLDGREMVQAIREHPQGREVPIILMSAAHGIADHHEIGHDFFIEKPFNLDVFLEHVKRLLGSKRP